MIKTDMVTPWAPEAEMTQLQASGHPGPQSHYALEEAKKEVGLCFGLATSRALRELHPLVSRPLSGGHLSP